MLVLHADSDDPGWNEHGVHFSFPEALEKDLLHGLRAEAIVIGRKKVDSKAQSGSNQTGQTATPQAPDNRKPAYSPQEDFSAQLGKSRNTNHDQAARSGDAPDL